MNALSTAEQLLRDGHLDQAAEAFVRVADQLLLEGSAADAVNVYRKALEANRNHDHALWQLADITASQGRHAEARQYLTALVDLRTLRDDEQGLSDCLDRLAALDAAPPPPPPPAAMDVDLSDLLAELGVEDDAPEGQDQ